MDVPHGEHSGDSQNRELDQECSPPAHSVVCETSHRPTTSASETEDDVGQALVKASVPQRDDLGHVDVGDSSQASRPGSLYHSTNEEERKSWSSCAHQRSNREECDAQ